MMDPGLQRTLILALSIIGLCTLAGVGLLTGHDPNGSIFYMVAAGLLGIAGTAAGAHASNGITAGWSYRQGAEGRREDKQAERPSAPPGTTGPGAQP